MNAVPPPALDTEGNRVSTGVDIGPSETYQERRRERYTLRKIAARLLPKEAVATCGQYPSTSWRTLAQPDGSLKRVRSEDDDRRTIAIKVAEGRAHVHGVVQCGSVWLCPVCAAKIAEGRRQEVELLMLDHLNAGRSAYMATLTLPHTAFQALDDLRAAVSGAWKAVQAGRAWMELKAAVGFLGSVRSLEVTQGGNGWHPHIHAIFFFEGKAPTLERAFGNVVYERWKAAVAKAGFGTTTQWAYEWSPVRSPVEAGGYVTKWGPDAELTKAHMKTGAKEGQRSPWQILRDVRDGSNPRDVALWCEYAAAFKGARQLTWSRAPNDVRELYAVADRDDVELATSEPAAAVTVAKLSARGFSILCGRGLIPALLEFVERDGARGVLGFCAAFRFSVSWFTWLGGGDDGAS